MFPIRLRVLRVVRQTTSFRCDSGVAFPAMSLAARLDQLGRSTGSGDKVAICDHRGKFTFRQLAVRTNKISQALKVSRQNIAFLCEQDADYVCAQMAIWRSGNVAVPLSKSHPWPLLSGYLNDSRSYAIVASGSLLHKIDASSFNGSVINLDHLLDSDCEDVVDDAGCDLDRDAMIVYTSGTTGFPKGVLTTHAILNAQVDSLHKAWLYSDRDCLLHVLPLHHVHGIVNCLLAPLAAGATVIMVPEFEPQTVWRHILHLDQDNGDSIKANLFMAVPTVYAKLIQFYKEKAKPDFFGLRPEEVRQLCQDSFRLMVSGSAALPKVFHDEWARISGHQLLSRYGMTEIGMALTESLDPAARVPCSVGLPFPGVRVRIVKEASQDEVLVEASGDSTEAVFPEASTDCSGDLQVKGPNVFKCYFGKPEATQAEFTADGWFKTGDTASFSQAVFHILGRSSVDIIKSRGYKISALEVERVLLDHPQIKDVAVVGLEDELLGQKVGAVVVLEDVSSPLDIQQIRTWAMEYLPAYCLPSELKLMPELPRNNMGKVNKKQLVKIAFPQPPTHESR